MTLRSTNNTHFIPDDLFVQFVSGELDHFDFSGDEAVAIYADGRREPSKRYIQPSRLKSLLQQELTDRKLQRSKALK